MKEESNHFQGPKPSSLLCLDRSWSRILEFSGLQPVEGCSFVGEGMPLALDARVVRVEGLADADHIQAGLVCQLLHQRRDLLHRSVVEVFLTYSTVNWQRDVGMSESGQVGSQTRRTHRASQDPALPP